MAAVAVVVAVKGLIQMGHLILCVTISVALLALCIEPMQYTNTRLPNLKQMPRIDGSRRFCTQTAAKLVQVKITSSDSSTYNTIITLQDPLSTKDLLQLNMKDHDILYKHAHAHSSLHKSLKWLTGSIAGAIETSFARLSLSLEIGHVSGWARTSTAWMVIEPVVGYTVQENNPTYYACLINMNEMEFTPSSLSHLLPAEKETSYQKLVNSTSDTPNESTFRSRRASSPQSSDHTICSIFVDYDSNFLDEWGGPCLTDKDETSCANIRQARAEAKVVDILHQVDGIYQDPENFNEKTIRFQIWGIYYLGNELGLSSSGEEIRAGEILSMYQRWLGKGAVNSRTQRVRGSSLPASQDVCLNHLFTHTNAGGTLGIASRASVEPNTAGGICSKTIFMSSNGPYVVNTGFTTTRTQRRPVPLMQTVLVTAHELGHNAGALHDCCETTSCDTARYPFCSTSPGQHICFPSDAQGGVFIMFPQITNNLAASNARRFSSCSRNEITEVVNAKGSCLLRPNPCRFGGECCDTDDNLLPEGTICRSADPLKPCLAAPVCDGKNAHCPQGIPLLDGTPCIVEANVGKLAVCHEGRCTNPHEGFCAAKLNFRGCLLSEDPCVRSCANDRDCLPYSGQCPLHTQQLFSWAGAVPCVYAPSETPCVLNGENGLCTDQGRCEICTSPDCGSVPSAPDFILCEWILENDFSGCSVLCGGGTREKHWRCVCDDGSENESLCLVEPPDPVVEDCNTHTCGMECECSNWSQWSLCSAPCGVGITTRIRTCKSVSDPQRGLCRSPKFSSIEVEKCYTAPCPIDCSCDDWNGWSSCSTSCGIGILTSTRQCHNPRLGGLSCDKLRLTMERSAPCDSGPCTTSCFRDDDCQQPSLCLAVINDTRNVCHNGKCQFSALRNGDGCNFSETNHLIPSIPSTRDTTTIATCLDGACTVIRRDCVTSGWNIRSSCSNCRIHQYRSIIQDKIGDGADCPALTSMEACCGVSLQLKTNSSQAFISDRLDQLPSLIRNNTFLIQQSGLLTSLQVHVHPTVYIVVFKRATSQSDLVTRDVRNVSQTDEVSESIYHVVISSKEISDKSLENLLTAARQSIEQELFLSITMVGTVPDPTSQSKTGISEVVIAVLIISLLISILASISAWYYCKSNRSNGTSTTAKHFATRYSTAQSPHTFNGITPSVTSGTVHEHKQNQYIASSGVRLLEQKSASSSNNSSNTNLCAPLPDLSKSSVCENSQDSNNVIHQYPKPSAPEKTVDRDNSKLHYVALTAYVPEHDNAIPLTQGEFVLVQEKTNNDWWHVRKDDGKMGYVPASCLAYNIGLGHRSSQRCLSLTVADVTTSVSTVDDCDFSTPVVVGKGLMSQKVRCMYDWKGRVTGELSVSAGSVLTVNWEDGEWLYCSSKQEEGLVPRSYVTRLTGKHIEFRQGDITLLSETSLTRFPQDVSSQIVPSKLKVPVKPRRAPTTSSGTSSFPQRNKLQTLAPLASEPNTCLSFQELNAVNRLNPKQAKFPKRPPRPPTIHTLTRKEDVVSVKPIKPTRPKPKPPRHPANHLPNKHQIAKPRIPQRPSKPPNNL